MTDISHARSRETRRRITASGTLLALSLVLAGCGGSGNNIASAPGPVSTPPPTPTPVPAPPPGVQTGFASLFGQYNVDGSDNLRPSGPDDGSSDDFRLDVDKTNNGYTVTLLGYITSVFDASTNVGPAQPTDEPNNFYYFRNDAGTGTDNLEIFRQGPGNGRISLDYLSYGLWTMIQPHASSETREADSQVFVFGEPTDKTALPSKGTAVYQGIVDGYYGTYRLLGSTGTLTADFGDWTVSTELALRTNGVRIADDASLPIGAGFEIGTLTGTGDIGCPISCGFNDIGADQNAYWGSLNGVLEGNSVVGSFDGSFFGPNAEEAGFNFAVGTYPYDQASGFAPGPSAAGVFVGKK